MANTKAASLTIEQRGLLSNLNARALAILNPTVEMCLEWKAAKLTELTGVHFTNRKVRATLNCKDMTVWQRTLTIAAQGGAQ